MAGRKLTSSLILLVSLITITCVAQHKEADGTTAQNEVKITNNLDDCIKISSNKPIESNGLLMLPTNWETEKNIGECGCKSALMNYYVKNLIASNNNKKILETVISSLGKKDFNFILNADATVKYIGNYEIVIGCERPD